jgi:superfamily II DNA/RNA helicase
MTQYQRELHAEAQEVVARIVAKWRRYRFLSEADKLRLMQALQRMRMVCDSSYLIDPKTDEGVKAAEAATLLGELLERPGTKAVVFSQWLRMHDLLVREAKDRDWGHVLFHGGVPGSKRKTLIERFRDDPGCRLFFSTDAGGVGLNLQFASVVLNMDLPWNPAVLEQRIGRVHRLGQRRPVRVVNFVAKGTIEEGMLAVLRFKKSLFAGVLDGGETEISFGGSRLKKFMETVEATTSEIPAVIATEADEAAEAAREFEGKPTAGDDGDDRRAAERSADPWTALLQAGAALFQQWTAPSAGGLPESAQSLVRRDDQTGETYLRLPVPSGEVIEQAVKAVEGLIAHFRRGVG